MNGFLATLALKSILVAIAGFALAALLARASAGVRHRLWGLTLAGMLALPMLMAALPALPLRWLASATPPAAATYPSMENALAPTGSVHLVRAETVTPAEEHDIPWRWFWAAAWLLGVGVCAARLGRDWICWRRTLRRAAVIDEAELDSLGARLGLRRWVGLRVSGQIQVPQVGGLWRPTVLLPAGAERWPRERRRVVLLHELAHARRGDCGWLLLARLACAAYWWNPLAWMAARRLRAAGEEACDQAALEAARREGVEACDYAAHLVAIARMVLADTSLAPLAAAMAQSSQVESRVNALLDRRRRLGMAAALPLLLLFAVGMAPLAAARFQQALPTFEAASVKSYAVHSGESISNEHSDPTHIAMVANLHRLIIRAYGLTEWELGKEPDWFKSKYYSIEAVSAQPSTNAQMMLMLRGVLADRFQLKLRQEQRLLPAYALEVAPGGLKVKPLAPGERPQRLPEPEGMFVNTWPNTIGLVNNLNSVYGGPMKLDRPVVDATHLDGNYDITLSTPMVVTTDASGRRVVEYPRLAHDLEAQAGLRLVATRAPLPYYVVESAAPPTAN